MTPRPHRKATLKQLVKLSEQNWSAPRELAEILAELRERDESEAEPVIRSIVRRLSVLHYQPESGGERFGRTEESRAGASAERRKRRRRILLAAVPAAAALAAWLLWPHKEPPAGDAASAGLELKGRGERTGEPPRPVTVRSSGAETFRHPLAPAGEAVEPPLVIRKLGRREPPAGGPKPLVSGVTASIFVTPQPPAVPVTHVDLLETLGVNIMNGRLRRPAEGGIYIGQARLRCYQTNSDPGACGRNLWGGNTRAGPIGRSRDIEVELAAARAEFGHTQPPGRSHPMVTGMRDSGGLPPLPREPYQPAARPPGKTATSPTPAPSCPASPPIDRTIFILDGSLSMGLPLWVGADLEDRLDAGILRKEPGARRRYRELLAEPGPKRITRAREAFAAAVKAMPSRVELGLVVFRECKDIRQVGIFAPDQRSQAINYIRSVIPRGRTPIADSLRAAAEMLGDGPGSIILLTDGREFCGGDPCAAAAEVHAQHPGTPINIVDISGQAKAECIAATTGGRVYAPGAADDLGRVLHNAVRGADANCPMQSAESAATPARAGSVAR